jgi:hypothetical protein
MSRPISTGNIRRHLTGCRCGRGWETDAPLAQIPEHVHQHSLINYMDGIILVHACTGCTWQVETYTQPNNPEYVATDDKVRAAFAKHLITTALEATA